MFLAELKEEQKELILDLGIYLSMTDGEFCDEEKNTIRQMCKEMEIAERIEKKLDFEEALKKLSENTTVREKRIILLEIGGIVLSDEKYSTEEKTAVENIAKGLGIDYSHCENAILLIKDLFDVYSEIGKFLSDK